MTICLATIHAKPLFLPLALMYLKASLVERFGFPLQDVRIVELAGCEDVESAAGRVLSQSPDIVGLSCYVWNVERLLAIAAVIKTRAPHVVIVIGGPEVGPVALEVLTSHPCVDVVVRSEGEGPIGQLALALQTHQSLDVVAGISFRRGDTLVETPDAPVVMDLNELPSPHRDVYADYAARNVTIETQRGCVFRCNFCFYNKDLSIRNRRFDLDRVKAEIQFWLARDVNSLFLMDPVFNLNLPRAKEICRFIAAHNVRGVRVHAEIWAEFVDDELAALMAAAGFVYLEVGLQTTDTRALASVERRLRLEPFLAGLGHLQRHGLFFELQLIYGLPHETVESFHRALDFAGRLGAPKLSIFMLMVLPGTELRRKSRELALEHDPTPPYLVRSHPTMTKNDIQAGFALVESLRFWVRTGTLQLLQRWPGRGLSTFLSAWAQQTCRHPSDGRTPRDAADFVREYCQAGGIPPQFVDPVLRRDFPLSPPPA